MGFRRGLMPGGLAVSASRLQPGALEAMLERQRLGRPCPHCGRRFKSEDGYGRHLTERHGQTPKPETGAEE